MPAEKQVIRINSLAGGVAKQSTTKRLPSEVSEADNVMLTLERSAEKRHGTQYIDTDESTYGDLDITDYDDDILYYYFNIDGSNKQIIVLNPGATDVGDIMQVFSAETGVKETAASLVTSLEAAINTNFRAYLDFGSSSYRDKLRFIEIKGNLMILNTEADAKFLVTGNGAAVSYTDPVTGGLVRDLNQESDPNGVLQDIGLNRKNYSQFRLPPDPSDPIKSNGADTLVGSGLVWYARESYLDFPGQAFFKANSSTQQPWYTLVRTEQAGSLFDGDTWPWLLEYDASSDDFAIGKPIWAPRYSGTRENNPGPSAINETSDPYNPTLATGVKLTAGVFFRNRLWFAAGDILFSSQYNDHFDFFIKDPSTIVDTDPIDITASSGENSTISWLVPYSDFLFVTTTGLTQYELKGSNNFIGPKTAALEPTSFYGTSRFTKPMKVGSLLFFTDAGRLFMYYGSSTNNIQTAVNISQNVFGYFPTTIDTVASAPNQDTLIFGDADNKNHLYMYTARFDADKMQQSAYYRWILAEDSQVQYTYVIDNELYLLLRRPNERVFGTPDVDQYGTFVEKVSMERTAPTDVHLDRKSTVVPDQMQDDDTLIPIPFIPSSDAGSEVVAWYDNQELTGTVEYDNTAPPEPIYYFRATGVDLRTQNVVVGERYTMTIDMSTPVMRDQYNNFIDGRLTLKDMNISHHNTGKYDVYFYRWTRNPTSVTFDPTRANNPNAPLGSYYEVEGSYSPKVQSTGTSSIKITSNYPVPVNITNIEYRVDFAPSLSSTLTQ